MNQIIIQFYNLRRNYKTLSNHSEQSNYKYFETNYRIIYFMILPKQNPILVDNNLDR